MPTPRDRSVWCTRLATSCGLINIGRRTSALLGLLLWVKRHRQTLPANLEFTIETKPEASLQIAMGSGWLADAAPLLVVMSLGRNM